MNKSVFYFIIFASIAFLTIQCGTKNNKSDYSWRTFQHGNFVLDYIDTWDVDSSGQFNVQIFTALSPETDDKGETLSLGIIAIIDSANLEQAVDNFISQWNSEVSKNKTITIGTQQALYNEGILNGTFFKNYYLKNDDKLYYMFVAGSDKAHKLWDGQAWDIISTARILKN